VAVDGAPVRVGAGLLELDDGLAVLAGLDVRDPADLLAGGVVDLQVVLGLALVLQLELDLLADLRGEAVEALEVEVGGGDLDLAVVGRLGRRGVAGDLDLGADAVALLAGLAGDLVLAAPQADVEVARRARRDVLDLSDDLVEGSAVALAVDVDLGHVLARVLHLELDLPRGEVGRGQRAGAVAGLDRRLLGAS
jgi:hypothetical protein